MATTTTPLASCEATAPPGPDAGIGRAGWRVAVASAVLTGIGAGGQRAFGVFVSQLMSGSSPGLATLALAFALGQQAIRTVQPLLGEARRTTCRFRAPACWASFLEVFTRSGASRVQRGH